MPSCFFHLQLQAIVTVVGFLQVLSSPPTGGRKHLQTSNTTCAVDLTNATTLASIITLAEQSALSAPTLSDEATRAALKQHLTPAVVAAVAAAVATLNSLVKTASDATFVELGQYYAQTRVNSDLHCFFRPLTWIVQETSISDCWPGYSTMVTANKHDLRTQVDLTSLCAVPAACAAGVAACHGRGPPCRIPCQDLCHCNHHSAVAAHAVYAASTHR